MAQVIKTTFQLRRGLLEVWERNNPVLAKGEPSFIIDKNALKIGDGVTPWKELDYIGLDQEDLTKAIEDYFEKNPEAGGTGKDGRGILSITRTEGSGTPGTVDIYTILYSDGTTSTFSVYNGQDGEDGYTPVKGMDYFTEADKQEIAEQAASMVEIPDSAGYVVQDTAPADTSVLWVDMSDDSDDGFQDAVNLVLAQAKASGEFDGKDGEQGPKGDKGEAGPKGDPGIYMGTEAPTDENIQVWIDPEGNWDDESGGIEVTGASVGQTVKIAEVNENGVPIAWEAVDFPSGGDTWELIARITVDEANTVSVIGKSLGAAYKKVLVYYRSAGDKVTTAGNWKISAGYNTTRVDKTFSTNATWTMHQALFEIANHVVLIDNAVRNSGTSGNAPATIATNGINHVQISTVNTDAFFPASTSNDNQVFNILGVRK